MNTEHAQVGWGFGLRWVFASVVGLAVAVAVGSAVSGAVFEAVGLAGGGAPGGALYGAITGGVLVWLLRQPAAKGLGPSQAAE